MAWVCGGVGVRWRRMCGAAHAVRRRQLQRHEGGESRQQLLLGAAARRCAGVVRSQAELDARAACARTQTGDEGRWRRWRPDGGGGGGGGGGGAGG
eukprot:3408302-Prymnesium_polylepis.1